MGLAIQATINGQGIAMTDITLIHQELKENKLLLPFSTAVPTGYSFYLVAPVTNHQHPAFTDFNN